MSVLKKIWEYEFPRYSTLLTDTRIIFFIVISVAVFFAVLSTLITPSAFLKQVITLVNFKEVSALYQADQLISFRSKLPYVWLVVAVFATVMRLTVYIRSYQLSVKKLGEQKFNFYFKTFLSSAFLGYVSMILVAISGNILLLMGKEPDWAAQLIESGIAHGKALLAFMEPYSLGVQSYPIALVLTILLASLPGYVVHYLSHKSRLIWLIGHRAHHLPEFLYPLAAPGNNLMVFEFLTGSLSVIFVTVISSVIYKETLIVEMAIWYTARLAFECFGHSLVHYDLAYRNPIIRNASRLFGDVGVYHLVHHSAYPQDQNVNFSYSPFMFWDRLFGTYRKPYEQAPPIGLTGLPRISMSPMRIVFNGFLQLWYEWKMNKDWVTRFKIIFGGVYYKPPITKDFLIVSNQYPLSL